jgi:hypothetical protein
VISAADTLWLLGRLGMLLGCICQPKLCAGCCCRCCRRYEPQQPFERSIAASKLIARKMRLTLSPCNHPLGKPAKPVHLLCTLRCKYQSTTERNSVAVVFEGLVE